MSKTYKFKLIDKTVRARAVQYVNTAPEGYVVKIGPDLRTLDQNAKLWPMLNDVAKQVEWYGRWLTTENWKDIFTASLRGCDVVPNIDSTGFVVLGLHTSKMNRKEFADLIEIIYSFGAEKGVVWSEKANDIYREAMG